MSAEVLLQVVEERVTLGVPLEQVELTGCTFHVDHVRQKDIDGIGSLLFCLKRRTLGIEQLQNVDGAARIRFRHQLQILARSLRRLSGKLQVRPRDADALQDVADSTLDS